MSSQPVARLLDRLGNVKKAGDGHTARCPSHEDKNNSLSINEGKDGCALVKCHAGCTTDQIVRSIELDLADLFEKKDSPSRVRRNKGGRVVYPPEHAINTAMQSGRLTISAAPSQSMQRSSGCL